MKSIVEDLAQGLVNGSIQMDQMQQVLSLSPEIVRSLSELTKNFSSLDELAQQQRFHSLQALLGSYLIRYGVLPTANEQDAMKNFQIKSVEASQQGVSEIAEHSLHTSLDAIMHSIPLFGSLSFIQKYSDLRSMGISIEQQRADLKKALGTDCRHMLGIYDLINKVHEREWAQLEEELTHHPDDVTSLERKSNLLNRWSDQKAYIQGFLRKEQQCLAQLDMQEQLTSRAKKVEVGRAIVGAAATSMHALGPLGSAVGIPIVGLSHLFGLVSKEYQRNSALLNHFVLPQAHVELEYDDQQGQKELFEQARCLESVHLNFLPTSLVAVRPMSIKERLKSTLINQNIRAIYTLSDIVSPRFSMMEASQRVIKHYFLSQRQQVSCQFPRYEVVPEKPPSDSSLSPLELHIEQLQEEQDLIQKTILWYNSLMSEMIRYSKEEQEICPYIENLAAIRQQLETQHLHIQEELNRLNHQDMQLERASWSPLTLKRLETIQSSQTVTRSQLNQFNELQTKLNSLTPFTPEQMERLKTTDPNSPEYLTQMVDHELHVQFILDTLEPLIKVAEKLGHGRHIENAGVWFAECRSLLNEIPDAVMSDDRKKPLLERIEFLEGRAFSTEQRRFDHLHQLHEEHPETFDAFDFQRELRAMESCIDTYQVSERLKQSFLSKIESRRKNISDQELVQALSSTGAMVGSHFSEEYVPVVFSSRFHEVMTDKDLDLISTTDPHDGKKTYPPMIQIVPGQSIDNAGFISTRNDERKLANLLEGLKREMQWVSSACQRCELHHIEIANLDRLIQYYQKQCELVLSRVEQLRSLDTDQRHVVVHAETRVGQGLAQAGNTLTDLRKVGLVFQNAQSELDRCMKVLLSLKNEGIIRRDRAMRAEIESLRTPSRDSAKNQGNSSSTKTPESPGATDSHDDDDDSEGPNESFH